jgi:hypothetical protein
VDYVYRLNTGDTYVVANVILEQIARVWDDSRQGRNRLAARRRSVHVDPLFWDECFSSTSPTLIARFLQHNRLTSKYFIDLHCINGDIGPMSSRSGGAEF